MSIAFSIIIPVGPGRNAVVALESLRAAGLEAGDEVLVIGDGHRPVVPETHGSLPLRVEKVEPGSGANAARNHGAVIAENDIFCFLDDDDAYAGSALSVLKRRIQEQPESRAWSLGWRFRSGRSNRSSRARPDSMDESHLRKRNRVGGCSSMVLRRDAFEQAGGFDREMPALQDWDLWWRVAQAGPIRVLHDIEVCYEDRHADRISRNAERRIAGFERLLEKYGADWTPAELAFHQSRLAATRFAAGSGPWTQILQWRAPLASLYFIWQAVKNRQAGGPVIDVS